MKNRKNVLRDAGVLLIAVVMVLTTVIIVVGNTVNKSVASGSDGYAGGEVC